MKLKMNPFTFFDSRRFSVTRCTSVFTFAGTLFLAIILSLIACDVTNAQGKGGKGGGGGGGGSQEPELPTYRFRVERVDLAPIAAQFGAVDATDGSRNSNLDALGHLRFEDGSFEPYLNLYTENGYQAHALGPWPEGAIFYLDPNDPDYNPNATRSPGIMLSDDLSFVVLHVWAWTPLDFECDGVEYEESALRSELVMVPIVESEGTYVLGTPHLLKQFLAWNASNISRNRFGDILYNQTWVVDLDDPCKNWWGETGVDETGILVRNQATNEYEDISINLSERLAQAGYDVERRGYSITRLNSQLQAIGTVDGIVYHYDILNDTVTDTDAILSNSSFLNHSDAGIVVGEKLGSNRGAIWDPHTGQVEEIPIDLGNAASTGFVPLAIRDRNEMSGPNDVQVLGRIWNSVSDNFSEVPVYFEDGQAFFLQDLVTDDSPDSEWFRSLDPPRISSLAQTASISADGSRMMFRVRSWYFDSELRVRIHTEAPRLVILHRVDVDPAEDLTVEVSYRDTGSNGRNLDVTISVASDAGSVSGAAVSATLVNLTRNRSWDYSGTTGSNGNFTFRRSNAPSGSYMLVIHDVTHPDYQWDGEYHDPGHSR